MLVTSQCERALSTRRIHDGNEGEPTPCLPTPVPDQKLGKTEGRFIKKVGCHLLASSLARACTDSQTFGTSFLMSYSPPGLECKVMRKARTVLFSYLDPTSPSQNVASRSERAAQSRMTASPSPLFMEVGLSLEREDAKLSHTREF